MKDSDIQKAVESGQYDSKDHDAKFYKEVFDALSTDPAHNLPQNFAENLAYMAGFSKSPIFSWKDLGILAGFILSAIIISIATFIFYNTIPEISFLSFFWEFKWYLLFGISVIACIQFADKFLITKIH